MCSVCKHLSLKPDVHVRNRSEISDREKNQQITFEQFDHMIIAIGQFFLHPSLEPISSIVAQDLRMPTQYKYIQYGHWASAPLSSESQVTWFAAML